MVLSRDEKTLYVTNVKTLVAFDIQPDGTTTNQHNFATLEAGGNGDGMAIDSEGRLYVTSGDPGIQVFSPDGKYLGIIPLPRSASSVAFSGPGKNVLYGKGAGMKNPDGTEYRTPEGAQQRQSHLQNRHDRPRLHGPPEITLSGERRRTAVNAQMVPERALRESHPSI